MKSFSTHALPFAVDNDVPYAELLLAPRGPAHSTHIPQVLTNNLEVWSILAQHPYPLMCPPSTTSVTSTKTEGKEHTREPPPTPAGARRAGSCTDPSLPGAGGWEGGSSYPPRLTYHYFFFHFLNCSSNVLALLWWYIHWRSSASKVEMSKWKLYKLWVKHPSPYSISCIKCYEFKVENPAIIASK